jgi:HSP20 family molecular chaperone IbpA
MKKEALAPKKAAAKSALKDVVILETSLDRLLEEMSEWSNRIAKRAYEFFAASGFTHGHDVEDWCKAEQEFLNPVLVEVTDSQDEFVIRAEVAGFAAKDLDIRVNGSHLVIMGKRSAGDVKRKKTGADSERMSREIYRLLELPAAVLAEKSHAELKKGVLELTLPKAEKLKARASAA